MLFYILLFAFIVYGNCISHIRLYFWNKKSPEQKYAAWRKERANYNHKNQIVDEFQYDYTRQSTDYDHQSIQAP